jgi:hypothetical protein
MHPVLPVVTELASPHPARTVFTRFIPPMRAADMSGMWQRYYRRWKAATREQLDPALLQLLPSLANLCPPATVIDKTRYSAFVEPHLFQHLQSREADGLIVTGSETDVCVLATVLGAVDLGYRVIVVRDAVCSSSYKGLLRLRSNRGLVDASGWFAWKNAQGDICRAVLRVLQSFNREKGLLWLRNPSAERVVSGPRKTCVTSKHTPVRELLLQRCQS